MDSVPAVEGVYCREWGERIGARAEVCPACGVRQRPPPIDPRRGGPRKHPGLAATASFLVPGLGQICNGEIGKGLVILAVIIGLAITIVGLVFTIPPWIWQMYGCLSKRRWCGDDVARTRHDRSGPRDRGGGLRPQMSG